MCGDDRSKQCRSQMGTLFFNFGFSTVHVDLGFLNPNQWSQSLYDDIDGGSLFVPTVFFMNWEIS